MDEMDFETAAELLGKALEPPRYDLFFNILPMKYPLTKWEYFRIWFWYFFKNTRRAQGIIIAHLERNYGL